jgi:hypothetical protein
MLVVTGIMQTMACANCHAVLRWDCDSILGYVLIHPSSSCEYANRKFTAPSIELSEAE